MAALTIADLVGTRGPRVLASLGARARRGPDNGACGYPVPDVGKRGRVARASPQVARALSRRDRDDARTLEPWTAFREAVRPRRDGLGNEASRLNVSHWPVSLRACFLVLRLRRLPGSLRRASRSCGGPRRRAPALLARAVRLTGRISLCMLCEGLARALWDVTEQLHKPRVFESSLLRDRGSATDVTARIADACGR
jgi:hypothetical protein